MKNVLKREELENLNDYFDALNYLSVGQLYLLDNPLLKRPLYKSDIKNRIVGHFGTVPGQNFIYIHLNRIIKKNDLNMIYISGPGHGGNALISNTYLEGSYSKIYPDITEDSEGMKKLFKQFSFPKGVSSHVAPSVPGSINEGGELGYSLVHAFGAVLDNPSLIAATVIGDGEAETGTLATSWHINKFLNKEKDGVVLPILHLNGYKIANPTVFARMTDFELVSFFEGCGWYPYIVSGKNKNELQNKMASTLDKVVKDINKIKTKKEKYYPMIILKTPKGWTGPKEIEGTFKSHQVPFEIKTEEDIKKLESWMKSYHPEKLFDDNGKLIKRLKDMVPKNKMGLNPNANGGLLLKDIKTPKMTDFMIDVKRGETKASDMMELGRYISEVISLNKNNFRIFGPDEALSNRLNHVFEKTNRQWNSKILKNDEYLNESGRVIDSFLSENICEGALEGYILTGRHGFFHCYEAFIRIVDSMASQHAKWLKVTKELPFREPISSLNYVLTSHIWQQDHNGFTHQDPGFLNHLATKKSDITRIYLPPDTNTLISCFDHIIQTKDYINVIVASKHPSIQWYTKEEAIDACTKGISIMDFASDPNPDVVLAAAGDTPTLEVLAATKLIKEFSPKTKVRVINVIDLMKLESNKKHPHGLSDAEFDRLFTTDKEVIFNFHGYPSLVHQLIYNRNNRKVHVHGYMEEGTITTPFDMRVQNKIDRYNLVLDVCKYVDIDNKEELIKYAKEMLKKHESTIGETGIDIDEVTNFKW